MPSSQTKAETAAVVPTSGAWPASTVCMPIRNVCARTAPPSSPVAGRAVRAIAAREMRDVGGRRAAVEQQGDEVHGRLVRSRRPAGEIPLARPRRPVPDA